MERLTVIILALALWASPATLHASLWHKARHTVVRHHVAGHPRTSHYTRKAQSHQVVKRPTVRHYTRKAHADKAARRLHKAHKHKKVGHI